MLWQILSGLLFAVNDTPIVPERFNSSLYVPKTPAEREKAHNAVYASLPSGHILVPQRAMPRNAQLSLEDEDTKMKWPKINKAVIVPFTIDSSARKYRPLIRRAMEQFSRTTCVRFEPRRDEEDYVNIYAGEDGKASIGRQGGKQDVSIGKGGNYVGTILHLLGHTIGLLHEHQRPTRDDYIHINEENIKEGHEDEFKRYENIYMRPYSSGYGYDSVMHYGSYAYSKHIPSKPTIVLSRWANSGFRFDLQKEIYEKTRLSEYDIRNIKQYYECDSDSS